MKRPDGSDWELGSGAFGRVVKGLRGGVQVTQTPVRSSLKCNPNTVVQFRKVVHGNKECARQHSKIKQWSAALAIAALCAPLNLQPF